MRSEPATTTAVSITHVSDINYTINGVLNFESVPALLREIKAVLKDKSAACIDFSGVTQSNSAGLAFVIEVARFMRGKTLQFTHMSAQIQAFAKAYGVEEELKEQGII